jgi:hypothetical protein
MEASNPVQAAHVTDGFGQAVRFLAEVRRRPELLRALREEAFDLDELIVLGQQMGFRFDGAALQQVFRHDFQLRMAVQQAAVRGSNTLDH